MSQHRLTIFSLGFLFDLLMSMASLWLAVSLVRGFGHADVSLNSLGLATAFFTLSIATAFFLSRLHQTVWRWTTFDDLVKIFLAITYATIGTLAFLFLASDIVTVPPFVPFIAGFCMFVMSAGARGMARSLSGGGYRALLRSVAADAPATILVGPTEAVTQAIHLARSQGDLPIRPIAIVSTLGNQVGKVFAGARVYGGLDNLEPLVVNALKHNASVRIALVGEDPKREAVQMALLVAGRKGVELMRFAGGAGTILGAVNPADVLGRQRRSLDMTAPRSLVRYKRVLVTGAGGTIGSEIVRQIAQLGPSTIIMVDSSENNLYQISTQIASEFPGMDIVARLCDVRDAKRINDLFDKHQPSVVVHAAANKHVPMMEAHFNEAIEVNLGGTCVVAEAALAIDVESFIFISTDKAVNPVNIMGAAKRIAELYVQDCAIRAQGAFHSVRFGNVLGSSGSVMPLFERQIASGGPITLTHKDMTRFFMTVGEATSLVLQAAALGATSKANLPAGQFVLDMGGPVKIIDLAEAMIRMKGKEPGRDISITETGLRPGERLHEELFHTFERVIETEVEGVMLASDNQPVPENLRSVVAKLLEAARLDQTRTALELLQRILPSFHRATPTAAGAQSDAVRSAMDI